jgi:DNA-binding response OmpR family regulator
MAKEILIIENEGLVAGMLSKSLKRKGYEPTPLDTKAALKHLRQHKPSLVILEAPAAAAQTFDVCRSLRELCTTPIIVLLDPPADVEEMEGVEYLTKPLDFRTVLAVVEDALNRQRRRIKRRPRVLRCGDLKLDLQTQRLTNGGQMYRLTPKEFLLLQMFMSSPGQVLSYKVIMKEVWKTDYLDDLRTLQVHISWLRKKIQNALDQPAYLRTVRGVGYRFEPRP